jgi:hypothetical protein
VAWGGFGWLWAKTKLLILNSFLALAVALAINDYKGLLGFGSAFSAIKLFVFSSLIKSGGFAAGGPKSRLFQISVG